MPTVIVTGASRGIGRALALAWAKRGATLALSARSAQDLRGVAREVEALGGRAIVEAGDVTDEGHRERLVERAAQESGGIDVLVNNAGRGFYVRALEIELDPLRELFELNVFAPLRLSQLAAPHVERARGTIVMLSSIAGVVAAPKYAAYAASKFALEALSMSMRAELAPRGIRVVVVRPGPVATPFRTHATKAAGDTEYTEPAKNAQSPDAVAEQTLRAVERGRAVVETSSFVRATSAAARVAPAAFRVIMKRMARRTR
jgi:short-subunit dehydrogenase